MKLLCCCCPALMEVDLSQTRVITEDLLKKAHYVAALNLSNVFVEEMRSSLRRFVNLTSLDLSSCYLHELPDEVVHLTQLQKLILANNPTLKALPPSIASLTALKELHLQNCGLDILPEELCQLNLVKLSVGGYKLELSPSISRLKRLSELYIGRSEKLKELPESLCQLNKATSPGNLTGAGNRIQTLPQELGETQLDELELSGNPITWPPENIWRQGVKAISSFFKEAKRSKLELFCAYTISIIGESNAGKTSIAWSLVKGKPVAETDFEQISIERTKVMQQLSAKVSESASVYINDFGGHAMYQSIIPVFLPFTGLSILAYDLSKEEDELQEEVEKWLLTVISKCSRIRIVVAGTHSDKLSPDACNAAKNNMRYFVSEVLEKQKIGIENAKKLLSSSDVQRSEELNVLLRKLKDAECEVLTVSCTTDEAGFRKFQDLIFKRITPPQEFSSRWLAIMEDILKKETSGLPYLTKSSVEMIYKKHIKDDVQCKDLSIILTYLASSAQIIWIKEHEYLKDYVFNSPCHLIEICKTILDHDRRWSRDLEPEYSDDIRRYNDGILTENLLQKLLSPLRLDYNVFVQFLKNFNLILEIHQQKSEHTHEKTFLITSNLPLKEPDDLHTIKATLEGSQNHVHVILYFIGSSVPISFFETSLSLIMSKINAHTKNKALTKQWRNGLSVSANNVHFVMLRLHEKITFIAGSEDTKRSPWLLLACALKVLHGYACNSWPGASLKWVVQCKGCCFVKGDCGKRLGEAEISIEEDEAPRIVGWPCTDLEFTFKECGHSVPRVLCSPLSTDTFTEEQQNIIATFHRDLVAVGQSKPQYPMNSSPHGDCVIINNVHFRTEPERNGSDKDAERLEETFTKLGYNVEIKKDLKAREMVTLLTNKARGYSAQFDSFVCCILTHGNEEFLMGCDDKPVSVEQLTTLFDSTHCLSLANKPKLFFIQACRGNKGVGALVRIEDKPASVSKSRNIADKADFLLSFATVPGYVSWRTKDGTPFIIALCNVLNRNSDRDDLLSMLIEVNDEVSMCELKGEYKQVPMPQFSLRRKIFFKKTRPDSDSTVTRPDTDVLPLRRTSGNEDRES